MGRKKRISSIAAFACLAIVPNGASGQSAEFTCTLGVQAAESTVTISCGDSSSEQREVIVLGPAMAKYLRREKIHDIGPTEIEPMRIQAEAFKDQIEDFREQADAGYPPEENQQRLHIYHEGIALYDRVMAGYYAWFDDSPRYTCSFSSTYEVVGCRVVGIDDATHFQRAVVMGELVIAFIEDPNAIGRFNVNRFEAETDALEAELESLSEFNETYLKENPLADQIYKAIRKFVSYYDSTVEDCRARMYEVLRQTAGA